MDYEEDIDVCFLFDLLYFDALLRSESVLPC